MRSALQRHMIIFLCAYNLYVFIRVNCATGNMGSQFRNFLLHITRLRESEEVEAEEGAGDGRGRKWRRQPQRPTDPHTRMLMARANPIQLPTRLEPSWSVN